MKKLILILVALVALVLLVVVIKNTGGCPDCEPTPTDNGTATSTATSTLNLIRVESPLPNATISSPVVISGEARGNWYFEASFPVHLYDAEGREIAVTPIQAQGEWMTTDFVPFETALAFPTPSTETGTLVLKKDNASGLPEHDAEIRIPVRFAPASSDKRKILLYYYNESKDKDAEGNILCSGQGLSIVERELPRTITPIQDAMHELLRGNLTSAERSRGIRTEFPLPGFALANAALKDDVLTLTFYDPQGKTSGGSCRVSVLRVQIEATARQFSEVKQVRIMPAGILEP